MPGESVDEGVAWERFKGYAWMSSDGYVALKFELRLGSLLVSSFVAEKKEMQKLVTLELVC